MALDFPDAPTVGQKFTPGGADKTWTWDGTTWNLQPPPPASVLGAVPPVPQFVGQRWLNADTGDECWWTGYEWVELGLPGPIGAQGETGPPGPTGATGPVGPAGPDTASDRVLKAGDTMTGDLVISSLIPKLWMDDTDRPANQRKWRWQLNGGNLELSQMSDDGLTKHFTPLTIKRDTGEVIFNGISVNSVSVPPATAVAHAVRKDQMDAADALKVAKAGDTMTGFLQITRSAGSASLQMAPVGASDPLAFYAETNGDLRIRRSTSPFQEVLRLNGGDGAPSVTVPTPTAFTHAANGAVRGTGSPEGVVTATIGMKYIDTNCTTGAVEWVKMTGSGNTGWRVTYGDTGWRTVTSWTSAGVVTGQALSASYAPTTGVAGSIRIKRTASTLTLSILYLEKLSNTAANVWSTYSLPLGYRPSTAAAFFVGSTGGASMGFVLGVAGGLARSSDSAVGLTTGQITNVTYTTDAESPVWPTVLI